MNDPVAAAPAAPVAAEPAQAAAPTSAASLIGGQSAPAEPVQSAPVQSAAEPTPGNFYDGVSDENRGFFENKKFSDLDAVAKSYKSLEAMKGVPENELVRIAKSEDADGMAAMYDKLGRPASAADYTFEGDDSADWFRDSSHQNGLNDAQASAIMKDFNAAVESANAGADEKFQQQSQLDMADLQKEWGAEFEANGEYSQNAARKFEITDDQLSAMEQSMGTKGLMNFMAKLGRATSEGSMANSQSDPTSGGLGVTPAAAKDQFNSLTNDPAWKERYFSSDPSIRKAAVLERSNLTRLMEGGE